MTVQSLVLLFPCFSFGPGKDSCFSYRPLDATKRARAEVSGHVALRVATANPHAVTRRCSGEAVCFPVADGVIAACVLSLCVYL